MIEPGATDIDSVMSTATAERIHAAVQAVQGIETADIAAAIRMIPIHSEAERRATIQALQTAVQMDPQSEHVATLPADEHRPGGLRRRTATRQGRQVLFFLTRLRRALAGVRHYTETGHSGSVPLRFRSATRL